MYLLELGGEDDQFAAYEAGHAASDVHIVSPGLATARSITPQRIRGLAYTHRVSETIGTTTASADSAAKLLTETTIDRVGSVAVRARTVRDLTGIDTQDVESALGTILTAQGLSVDLDNPDHTLLAIFSTGFNGNEPSEESNNGWNRPSCILGWQIEASVRDFGQRAPTNKPFFQPGSMDPLLARALANIAGAKPATTILDPMCGTGGILVEAGLLGANVIGFDLQGKMVTGTRQNFREFLSGQSAIGQQCGTWEVGRSDATRLPLQTGSVDAVVLDVPYGRQSTLAGYDQETLLAGVIAEVTRVAKRVVIVGDQQLPVSILPDSVTIEARFSRYVHRSLTRHILVCERESSTT